MSTVAPVNQAPKESLTDVLLESIVVLFKVWYFYLEALFRCIIPAKPKALDGEVVVVTGGGRGIGKEIAKQVSRLGIRAIAIWDLDLATAQSTAKEISEETGVTSMAFKCDVGNREDVKQVAEKTRSALGRVTILFNNAGIMPCKPLLKHTPSDVEKVFRVNVFSQFWTVLEFLDDFIKQGKGHIVSMSSTAGVFTAPNLSVYSSSKFAITGLNLSMIAELDEFYSEANIKVTSIHPFVVNTGLAHKPRTRFEKLVPFTDPEAAATTIIDGMRREESIVFVPRRLKLLYVIMNLIPTKALLVMNRFLGCGVDEHDH